jgi:hypothetical protein
LLVIWNGCDKKAHADAGYYVATNSDAASHQISSNRSIDPPNFIKVYLLYSACCVSYGHEFKRVKFVLGILPKTKGLLEYPS